MLEKIDLKKKIEKAQYKELYNEMAIKLREMQQKIKEKQIPLVIVFEGWEMAGKGTQISRLAEILDPRGFEVFPISPPLEEEALRPFLWRFWLKLPDNGMTAIFDQSWYGRVLQERVNKTVPEEIWSKAYRSINQFERQLVDSDAVIVKLFLHISKKEQKKRFKKCLESKYDKWRITNASWKEHKNYSDYEQAIEEMLAKTSTHEAPWTVVECTDKRYATLKILKTILESVDFRLRNINADKTILDTPKEERLINGTYNIDVSSSILDKVDLTKKLEKDEYVDQLNQFQLKMRELEFEIYNYRIPVIIVYEGWDAGGKGGNIRRLTAKLDPRGYTVHTYSAPRGDEKTHHYLWRFWKHIPKAGHIAIFDRSWYGRVLVERVEGFASELEWKKAYQEINEFEEQLYDFNSVIVKFWLHIDKEEQLRRFEARRDNPFKRYKLTEEDWRNREKWDVYEKAVVEMLQRTSTTYAPWTVIEGNCKWYARVKALKTVCKAIEDNIAAYKKAKKK